MKKFILSAGIVLASATAAFAQSSILDVYVPEPVNASAIDYTATAAIGADYQSMANPRLGDGAPVHVSQSGPIDFIATAATGGSDYGMELGPRLGDGDPY
jgi:hypothetical protein